MIRTIFFCPCWFIEITRKRVSVKMFSFAVLMLDAQKRKQYADNKKPLAETIQMFEYFFEVIVFGESENNQTAISSYFFDKLEKG